MRTDGEPEATRRLKGPVVAAELLVNLRAEAEPEDMAVVVRTALEAMPGRLTVAANQHFRPGQPNPVHRVDGVS